MFQYYAQNQSSYIFKKTSLTFLWLFADLNVVFPPTKTTILFTSLAKEVMFLVALICLFICLSVGGQHYSKSYERIGI